MADVKVTINTAALKKLDDAMAWALAQTGDEILSRERNDAVIPMDTGAMQNEDTHVDDSQASSGHVRIVTDAAQARRLYFHPEYNFRREHNSSARGEWWEPWVSGARRNDAVKIFAAMVARNGKESGVVK